MNYHTRRAAHVKRAATLKSAKRLRRQRAEIVAAYLHCCAKSKTRKRSVDKLMAERGFERVDYTGTIDNQWKVIS